MVIPEEMTKNTSLSDHNNNINLKNIEQSNICYTIADSGCTSDYISSNTPHSNIQPSAQLVTVSLPTGAQRTSTHTGELALHNVPKEVKQASIFQK